MAGREEQARRARHTSRLATELADARAEVERLTRELGEHQFVEWHATVDRDVAIGERDRLGANAALHRAALEFLKEYRTSGGINPLCVSRPPCGDCVWCALGAALETDPDTWLAERIAREVEPYRETLRYIQRVHKAKGMEVFDDGRDVIASLLGAPQGGAGTEADEESLPTQAQIQHAKSWGLDL